MHFRKVNFCESIATTQLLHQVLWVYQVAMWFQLQVHCYCIPEVLLWFDLEGLRFR